MRFTSLPAPAVIVLLLLLAPQPADADPLPRLAVSVPPGGTVADVLRAIQAVGARDVTIVVPAISARIGGAGEALDTAPPLAPSPSLPAGIDLHRHLTLTIGEMPGAAGEREAFVDLRTSDIVAALHLDLTPVQGLVLEVTDPGPSPEVFSFAMASLIVKARAIGRNLHVSVLLPASAPLPFDDLARRVAPYADSFTLDRAAAAVLRTRPNWGVPAGKPAVLRVGSVAGGAGGPAGAFLDALVEAGAPGAAKLWVEPPTTAAVREVSAAAQFLAQTLGGRFEVTAPERAPATVRLDGQPAQQALAFVGSGTADVAFLVETRSSAGAPRELQVTLGAAGTPQVACFDAVTGRQLPARAGAQPVAGCSSNADYTLVHVRRSGGEERLFEAVKVTAQAGLSVEEIIARWQASREAERRSLDNYVASCFLSLHFESNSFGIGADVALDLQQYFDRTGVNDWIQTGLFVNGVRLSVREFPLPQLEPERVVTKPLELTIDQKYGYRLSGTETVNDRLCYVVDVEPAETAELLYAGRIWIDGETFRQVRVRLEQRTGRNNVAAHVETQDFAPVRDASGREFTLFSRIFTEETLNLGGRPVMLERTYRFENYAANVPDFASRLDGARAADRPMYRDTRDGLRTLHRDGDALVPDPAPSKRIRSLVGGVIVDGSLGFPVPLAGVSWADFDFGGSGSQWSAVFAGALFAGNLSRQRSESIRTSFEFSLSALPSTLRTYEGNTERKGEQVRIFEQTVGAIVNYQATPALTLSASSHLALHPFMRTGSTDRAYRTPSLGVNLRAWGEVRFVRRSLEVVALVEPVVRVAGWKDYGYEEGGLQHPARAYAKYDVEVSQHLYVGKLARGGVSAAYYGGANLDRFSRYQSSFLTKPRIVGIPAGVDTFDAIGLAGAYYGFNVLDLVKLEGSYNHAWARNLDESSRFQQFDGVDFDIGTAGPWGTYVQAAFGYSLRGNLDRYGSRWGAQVLVFKPMRR